MERKNNSSLTLSDGENVMANKAGCIPNKVNPSSNQVVYKLCKGSLFPVFRIVPM